MRSLCYPNWFQLLLPHHWHRNKWAVFYQSWNVQTCESNQVHRRPWLGTHAAFLSYDLITRLFSTTVKGVALTRLDIVWSYTLEEVNVLTVGWYVAPVAVILGRLGGTDDGADRFSMQIVPVRTAPWELLINQIIAVSKWRPGLGGMTSRC